MKLDVRILLVLSTIGILSCIFLPGVNAEIFDIGEIMESDLELASPVYHPFTSGAIVRADDLEINLTSLIFDGNLNTGIEKNYSMRFLDWKVYFRFPLYVNNITIKPRFGNGSSNFTLTVFVVDTIDRGFNLAYHASGEKVFQMNCYLSAIDFEIYPNGTDQFYFNDVIINYDPTLSIPDELQDQIDNLTAQIIVLNNEIENLTSEIEDLKSEDKDDLNITDLLFQPPYIGLLLLILVIILIVILSARKSKKKERVDLTQETPSNQSVAPQADQQPQQPQELEEVEAGFCPNCGKYTEEKGPFCPYCHRSRI